MTRARTIPVILIAVMLILLATAGGAGYWFGTHRGSETTSAPSSDKKPLYWYDPMVPDTHFDKPGKSPFMDMQLVPKYAGGAGDEVGTVRVAATTLQNLGVRTAEVEVGTLSAGALVPGSVAWDLRSAYEVNARVDGVIDKLFVRAPYEAVHKGQVLAELLAPEWSAAAQEYLALGNADSADARDLQSAARNRLRVLGMDEDQIRGLRGSNPRISLRAPSDGVVSALQVRQGQSVQAGTPLMTINSLDTVWIEASIPQAQASEIAAGSTVQVHVSALPGETFNGVVQITLPDVDAGTRTQRARIVLDNPDHRLAPGMFAELQFAGAHGASHPLVPDEALIATGTSARVIVAEDEGRFRPVRVVTGYSSGGKTEILEGLNGGERVVVSGQFLIDSEASLSGALERLSGPDAASEGHGESHDGMAGMHDHAAMPAPATDAGTHAQESEHPHDMHDMQDSSGSPREHQHESEHEHDQEPPR